METELGMVADCLLSLFAQEAVARKWEKEVGAMACALWLRGERESWDVVTG